MNLTQSEGDVIKFPNYGIGQKIYTEFMTLPLYRQPLHHEHIPAFRSHTSLPDRPIPVRFQ